MARKTRKQKKRADKRRKVQTIPPSIADSKDDSKKEQVRLQTPSKIKKKEAPVYTESSYDKKLRQFTKQDITRTFVITLTLFILQGLFFYFNPFI